MDDEKPRALPARLPRATATIVSPKRRKGRVRKALPIATITIYNPAKLAALRTAQELGCEFGVTFDGFHLTITATPPKDTSNG